MNPRISFESRSDDAERDRVAVATIWPVVADESGIAVDVPVFSAQPILVGGAASESSSYATWLELPAAGKYLVDVTLPNGTQTRRTIAVAEGEAVQFSVVNIAHGPVLEQEKSSSSSVPRVALARALRSDNTQPAFELRVVTSAPSTDANGVHDPCQFAQSLKLGDPKNQPLHQLDSQDLSVGVALNDPPPRDFQSNFRRAWLLVAGGGDDQLLVAYPQWNATEGRDGVFANFDRATILGPLAEAAWQSRLELRNARDNSVIEYLNRRDITAATTLYDGFKDWASDMLFEKNRNPFAAAAGSYLLALTRDPGRREQGWLHNLSTRFTWLPDGPIALGWRVLRDAEGHAESWAHARHLFLQAVGRGIPYYTVGLRLLVDGLTLLSMRNPDDDEIQRLLSEVTALDLVCLRTEPFTSLRLWQYRGLKWNSRPSAVTEPSGKE